MKQLIIESLAPVMLSGEAFDKSQNRLHDGREVTIKVKYREHNIIIT